MQRVKWPLEEAHRLGARLSAHLYPLWPGLLKSLADAPLERVLATAAGEDCWLRTADRQLLQVACTFTRSADTQYSVPLREVEERPPYFTPAHGALIRCNCNFKAWPGLQMDSSVAPGMEVRLPVPAR